MALALLLILVFISLVAIGQINSAAKDRAVVNYFKDHQISHLVICADEDSMTKWRSELDRIKYPDAKFVSLLHFQDEVHQLPKKQLESIVSKYGVMKYPCLLSYTDGRLSARHLARN